MQFEDHVSFYVVVSNGSRDLEPQLQFEALLDRILYALTLVYDCIICTDLCTRPIFLAESDNAFKPYCLADATYLCRSPQSCDTRMMRATDGTIV